MCLIYVVMPHYHRQLIKNIAAWNNLNQHLPTPTLCKKIAGRTPVCKPVCKQFAGRITPATFWLEAAAEKKRC